jgi:hypothetical protein
VPALTGLSAGTYQVFTTWKVSSGRSTNAPFSVYDGTQLLASKAMNQTLQPNDATAGGVGWETIGTFDVTSGNLTVKVTNQVNNTYVIADAIRVVRVA